MWLNQGINDRGAYLRFGSLVGLIDDEQVSLGLEDINVLVKLASHHLRSP